MTAAQKGSLIDGLVEAGVRHIEATSFVHPASVPQLADADEVMARAVARHGGAGIELAGLVFNDRGYERAVAGGCRSLAFGAAVSETFSLRNTHNTPRQALDIARRLVARAQGEGLRTRFCLLYTSRCV